MADYDLKYTGQQIDALLATANELKTAGYIYKGVATPSTNPGTPTERVAYLASEPGTYTNFGGIVIASGLYSLTYASGTWTGTQIQDIKMEIRDGEDDFTLADDNGNVLLKLSAGHIKTKKFDSQEVGNDKPLRNKTFSLIGDSISTYAGHLVSSKQGYDGTAYNTYYPHTDNDLDNVTKTWWWKLCDLSGMVLMNNCAWSGSQATGTSTNTTSAIAGCSTRRVEDLSFASNTNPDIIIIYIGINDLKDRALGSWTGNDEIPAEGTIVTFREAYALMTKKVLARYPASEVYCCTILDAGRTPFDTDDGTQTISSYPTKNIDTGCTVAMYNNAIREIAHALGAMVVDIHGCGINFWNLDTYTGDRVHPNSAGATLIADKVYKDIKSQSKY